MKFEPGSLPQWPALLQRRFGHVTSEQLLWALRMALLLLGTLACLRALMSLAGGDGRQLPATDAALKQGVSRIEQPTLDVATVESWAWFSEAAEPAPEVEILEPQPMELVQTKLALRLEGIVVGADPESSRAIIEISGKSDSYRIGSRLPIGRNVVIRMIVRDAVHLDNNGRLEELPLFTEQSMGARKLTQPQRGERKSARAGVQTPARPDDPAVLETLGRYRKRIQRNPAAAARLLTHELYVENGRPTGFRIGPAGNARDFAQLGLQNDDVVTHINGVQLTDFTQSASLLEQLDQMSEVRVQLLRKGQPQEIVYRLPETN